MSQPYIGEIRLFPYNFAPRDWIDCDGRLLPISQYDALFALIGTTWVRLTSPTVGLNPTMPLTAAGQVIDPSVSVPMAAGASPAAGSVELTLERIFAAQP